MSTPTPSHTTSSGATTNTPTGRGPPPNPRTGNNRGSRGSRGGRGNRTNTAGATAASTSASLFVGHNDEMKGHVFQTYEEQTDRLQFDKTVKALAAYAKHNLKYHTDIACLFATPMRVPSIAFHWLRRAHENDIC